MDVTSVAFCYCKRKTPSKEALILTFDPHRKFFENATHKCASRHSARKKKEKKKRKKKKREKEKHYIPLQ